MSQLEIIPVGASLSWTPINVEGWSYGDTVCNEFVVARENHTDELTEDQHTAYMVWSEHEQIGKIIRRDDDGTKIELHTPLEISLELFKVVCYQDDQRGDWSLVNPAWENELGTNGSYTKTHSCIPIRRQDGMNVCVYCGAEMTEQE